MRSLVIKFGSEVARRTESREGAPGWWNDVDAWLAIAGYPPRRDRPAAAAGANSAHREPPAATRERAPAERPEPAAEDPAGQEPASKHYHPCYDRLPCGDSYFHIFWVRDAEERAVYQLKFPAPVDYKKRAGTLKHDLSNLTKAQFERRYAQYRHEESG